MSRAVVSVVAILALSCALAPGATAHTKQYSTSTTFFREIQPGGQFAVYYGAVSSSNKSCVAGRTVTLGGNGGALGSATTDSAGNWRTGVLFNDSTAGVGVLQKKIKKNKKHKHICKQYAFIP